MLTETQQPQPENIHALIEALRGESLYILCAASAALHAGNRECKAFVAPLIVGLAHPHPVVRRSAIMALGSAAQGSPEGVQALVKYRPVNETASRFNQNCRTNPV